MSLNFHVTQVYDDKTKWTNTVITTKEVLFMNYVSINIAKQTHHASITNSDDEILVEPFPFSNDHDRFQKLLKQISSFSQEDVLVDMESTAHYAKNLTSFLFTRGLKNLYHQSPSDFLASNV